MPRVLVVTKTPLAARLERADLDRLRLSGVLDEGRLQAAHAQHLETLAAVRAALAGADVRERSVDEVTAADASGIELVVTVGGDGTVFAANTLGIDVPYLTVNSDPVGSVGHFTRARAATMAEAYARWRDGAAQLESVPRLLARVAGRSWRVLNDCLFSSTNPAAMTRYLLEVDGRRERQRSSGVWVATGAGSTAAIHSAGADPVEAHLPALLFRVREPFDAQGRVEIRGGTQTPPRSLQLTPAAPGVALYVDGPNITVPLAAGATVSFSAEAPPLLLVR